MNADLQSQLALQSVRTFSKEDLVMLEGFWNDDVIVQLYKAKGLPVPEILANDEPEPIQTSHGNRKNETL